MNGFHHIRARARASKKLEQYPSRHPGKRLLDYFMYAVGLAAPLALVPQILELYANKSSEGMSLLTWVLLTCVNACWAFYAIVHKDNHILFANILMALFNSTLVVGILMY
jgi:uncharacterized protein with PQ loop repeat